VHPRTLLEELLRLRMVSLVGERVAITTDAFVPAAEQGEILRFLADNLHDHVAAAVTNVEGGADRFLEQALFADELHPESVVQIERLARQHWQRLLRELTPQLQAMVDTDRADPKTADARVRIGMYSYSAPMNPAREHTPAPASAAPPLRGRRRKTPNDELQRCFPTGARWWLLRLALMRSCGSRRSLAVSAAAARQATTDSFSLGAAEASVPSSSMACVTTLPRRPSLG
jgi:hypothetical protein